MAVAISWLLIIGVSISAIVVAVGLVLMMLSGQTGYNEALSPDLLLVPECQLPFPTAVSTVLQGVLALKPFAIIQLGILLLVATPVLRVAATFILFLAEKDRLYAQITLAVLILLLLSLFWIR